MTFSEHQMHTRVWSVVTCSYLLQLSFKLDLSPPPHHHLRVGDAAGEAGVWCSLIQALGDVLLVAQLLSLCFLLALLQFLLLAFWEPTLEIRCHCRVGGIAETTPLHSPITLLHNKILSQLNVQKNQIEQNNISNSVTVFEQLH